jgi:hypothetical protein
LRYASCFAFFLDHEETLVCGGDLFDPGILVVWKDDEVGWHRAYRLVLGPGYAHALTAVCAAALTEEGFTLIELPVRPGSGNIVLR